MPNRIIREDILTSESVDKLDYAAEVFYRRLLSKVDDYGRFYANPKLLLSNLYQLRANDVKCQQIEKWLSQTVDAKLVTVYLNDGKLYLEVCKFGQRERTPSKFPAPPKRDCAQMSANGGHMSANGEQMTDLRAGGGAPTAVSVSVAEGVSVSEGVISNCEQLTALDAPKKSKPQFACKPETMEECVAFVTEKLQLPKTDGVWLWDHWMASGFRINGRPMASWKHGASNWKAQRYFPSLKDQKR